MSDVVQLKDMICPQCNKLMWMTFQLIRDTYGDDPLTLNISACPSGGIYAISIKCPHCDYEETL